MRSITPGRSTELSCKLDRGQQLGMHNNTRLMAELSSSPVSLAYFRLSEENFKPAANGFWLLAASIWLLLAVRLHDGFRLLAAGCQLLALAPACCATAG